MTRAALAVMAGLLCGLLGMKQAASLHAEEKRLLRWTAVLKRLTVLLRQQASTLPELFCQAANGQHPPDETLRAMASHMQAHPLDTLPAAFRQCSGACQEQEALLRVFAGLSHGPLESRVLAVEQGVQELSLLAESAKQRADRDAKLYRTLGWTGGACLTLFLL